MQTANKQKEEITYVSNSINEIVETVRKSLLEGCYRVWVSHNYVDPQNGKFKLETARDLNATD